MDVQVVPKTVQYKNQNEQLGAVGGCLIGELFHLFLDRVHSSEELGKFILCVLHTTEPHNSKLELEGDPKSIK